MAKILVLIVSEQAAPNAMFIKEKMREFDMLISAFSGSARPGGGQ